MTKCRPSLSDDLTARILGSPVKAVVLAGGKGTRLAPYTSILPKPLMPIGGKSILEIVLRQLGNYGIRDVTLCVGYLAHLIEAVIGDGSAAGASVTYVRESEACGTAGPLRLACDLDSTFVVMNGDILTTLDYGALLRYHRAQKNLVTVAANMLRTQIDYGVLHVDQEGDRGRLRQFVEKPQITTRVSMGVYVVEPGALDHIPPKGSFDFPDLLHALLEANERVGVFDFNGPWFDIGQGADYEAAASAWANGHLEGVARQEPVAVAAGH